jgi:hypothetical protein
VAHDGFHAGFLLTPVPVVLAAVTSMLRGSAVSALKTPRGVEQAMG